MDINLKKTMVEQIIEVKNTPYILVNVYLTFFLKF
jgi:hypothetical protein